MNDRTDDETSMAAERDDLRGWTLDEIEAQTAEAPIEGDRASEKRSPARTTGGPAAALFGAMAALPDELSPNYRHLHGLVASAQFELTPERLAELCERNDFDTGAAGEVVLFGLRGCRLDHPADGEFHASVRLALADIDHRASRCVLGVWRRGATPAVAVFTGSTVPNIGALTRSVNEPNYRANMLPTGFYRYEVGKHKQIEGAFREQGQRVVIRAQTQLRYDVHDEFDDCRPFDNIHPSMYPASKRFSSAGCQTVRGTASKATSVHYDADDEPGWKMFRARAGVTGAGKEYRYILLTGREAALVGTSGAGLRRLRFGSSGARVRGLQTALGVAASGEFDVATMRAWVARQQGDGADGIVSPTYAAAWGGW